MDGWTYLFTVEDGVEVWEGDDGRFCFIVDPNNDFGLSGKGRSVVRARADWIRLESNGRRFGGKVALYEPTRTMKEEYEAS